jgi:hypothetical protein
MRFEYILLICIFILPIIYKLWYWQDIFESYDNNLKSFFGFIKTQKGINKVLHFWIFLEIPVFALSIVPFFNAPFEIFLYSIMFYFWVLYNVFVIGKIRRKKIIYPKINNILFFTILLLLIDWYLSYIIDIKYLYVYLASVVLFMPLYFIVILFFKNLLWKK